MSMILVRRCRNKKRLAMGRYCRAEIRVAVAFDKGGNMECSWTTLRLIVTNNSYC